MLRSAFVLASLASALDVEVDCSDFTNYIIDGQPDAPLAVNVGDVINFNINGAHCGLHPFQIRLRGLSIPYTYGVSPTNPQVGGTVTLTTTADTLAALDYQCANHAQMNGQINVAGGLSISDTPTGVTVSNASFTEFDLTWTAGVTSNCNFSHWAVIVTPGDSAPAGCLAATLTDKMTTACHPSGLEQGTNYSFTVQEVCFTPFASSAVSAPAMGTTLVNAATAPTGAAASSPTATTAMLNWTAGSANDCMFASWGVQFTSGSTGNVLGCNGITNRSVTTCLATGLAPDGNYKFSVTEKCTNPVANSPESAESAVFTTIIDPPLTVTLSNPSPNSLDIAWTASTPQCAASNGWEVQDVSGDPVDGCTSITSRSTMSCTATGLSVATAYSFKVREVCLDGVMSAFTASNTLSTSVVVSVQVNCTASNAYFLLNGAQNADLNVSAGDTVVFTVYDCDFHPFAIQRLDAAPTGTLLSQLSLGGGATGTIAAGITNGSLTLSSSTSTPMYLAYSSNNPAMRGKITVAGGTVTKASVPTSLTDSKTTDISTVISWSAGASQGDCVFAGWNVIGSPSGSCSSTTYVNRSCIVTGLTKSTTYQFTAEQVCANNAANSGASSALSVTTLNSPATVKTCQLGGTCNCGNVSSCMCQNTEVCNCDYAETCTCQLGKCNGGYSKMFVCQSSTCNVQCAEQCMGLCLPTLDIGRRLLGKTACVAAAPGLSVNLLLLAGLFLLAWK